MLKILSLCLCVVVLGCDVLSCSNPQPYVVPFGGGKPRRLMEDWPSEVIPLFGRVVYLPCGGCLACRRERRQDYTCLQVLESLEHEDSWFVTLTYDDEHLPADRSLSKVHLSSFFESLRHYCKYNGLPCRYFSVGEYGERYGRPHYHFSLFGMSLKDLGLSEDDSESFRFDFLNRGSLVSIREGVYDENGNRFFRSPVIGSRWPYGHHQIYRANRETFQYVAGYVTKKLSGSALRDFKASGKLPPFSLQSRPSIGYTWWLKNYKRLSVYYKSPSGEKVLVNDSIDVPGMSWRIPRICMRWLERKEGRLFVDRIKTVRMSKVDSVPDRVYLHNKDLADKHRALRYTQNTTHKEVSSNE